MQVVNYNYYFDIAALVIYVVVLFFYFWRLHVANLQDRCFCVLLFVSFFMTLFDLLASLFLSKENTPINVLWALNIFYYIFDISVAPTYAVYSLAISGFFHKSAPGDRGDKIITLFALIIPYFFTMFFVLFSPLFVAIGKDSLAVFRITEDGRYERGGFMFIGIYIVTAYYCVLSFMVMLMHRKQFLYGGKFIIIISFFLLSVLGLVLQTIFPNLLVQCFCVSVAAIVFSYTVKKPEDYYSSTTGLFNRKSLPIILNPQFKKGSFAAIGIVVDDITYLSSSFGISQLESLMHELSFEMKELFPRTKIFSVAPGRFLICFRKYDEKNIQKNIEQIKERFSRNWIIGETEKVSLKLYIRICYMKCPEDADSAEEIIDVINFVAEEKNFDKKIVNVRDIDWTARRRTKTIEYELRKGVVDNKFQVYYQPIYSVKENMFVGAEALCRLQDDNGNFISPDEFIPIAERNGTIFKIGQRVLESVCRMLANIRNPADFGIKKIHINLSVCQCMQDIMSDMILTTLSNYHINPSVLSLEITENTFDYMPEIFNRNIRRLSEAGIEVVMDDYGIGYSNLNYLLEVPFKLVKIDRSIVWSSENDKNRRIALEATCSMIKQFGMPVLAEGIETKSQASLMRSFGCDYLQGFFFGRPVPENEFLNMMSLRYKRIDF